MVHPWSLSAALNRTPLSQDDQSQHHEFEASCHATTPLVMEVQDTYVGHLAQVASAWSALEPPKPWSCPSCGVECDAAATVCQACGVARRAAATGDGAPQSQSMSYGATAELPGLQVTLIRCQRHGPLPVIKVREDAARGP